MEPEREAGPAQGGEGAKGKVGVRNGRGWPWVWPEGRIRTSSRVTNFCSQIKHLLCVRP